MLTLAAAVKMVAATSFFLISAFGLSTPDFHGKWSSSTYLKGCSLSYWRCVRGVQELERDSWSLEDRFLGWHLLSILGFSSNPASMRRNAASLTVWRNERFQRSDGISWAATICLLAPTRTKLSAGIKRISPDIFQRSTPGGSEVVVE